MPRVPLDGLAQIDDDRSDADFDEIETGLLLYDYFTDSVILAIEARIIGYNIVLGVN